MAREGAGGGETAAAAGGAGAAPGGSGSGTSAAGGSGPVWGWWGAAEARAALQRLEALPGSARDRATQPWVSNHYRWIVWKLAAYERRCVVRARARVVPYCRRAPGVVPYSRRAPAAS
jgi:hypothetical protein